MKFQICESIEELKRGRRHRYPEGAERCDQRFAVAAAPLFESGDLPLKPLETLILPGNQKIVFIGISKTGDSRPGGAPLNGSARLKKAKSIAFAGGDLRAMAEGATRGQLLPSKTYKTNNHSPAVERVVFVGGEPRALDKARLWRIHQLGESPHQRAFQSGNHRGRLPSAPGNGRKRGFDGLTFWKKKDSRAEDGSASRCEPGQ